MFGADGEVHSSDDFFVSLLRSRGSPALIPNGQFCEISRQASVPETFEGISELVAPGATAALAPAKFASHTALSIDADLERFEKVLRGKAREEIRRYISDGEMLARKGDEIVSVPIPQVDLPHFELSRSEQNGQGSASAGEDGADQTEGDGIGQAGEQAGQHILEVDVRIEDLAEMLGEELALPPIEPRGKRQLNSQKPTYDSISRQGPESLRHFRRSFKEALKRQIASDSYDQDDPQIAIEREDKRFRAARIQPEPQGNAVVFHLMDVSGSMGKEQKDAARATSFWTDTWIEKHYDNILHVYIVHDAQAKEVDRETFFNLRESGGTKISSAYEKLLELLQTKFQPKDWNIYVFQYSDGDNWSAQDTGRCRELLKEQILPQVNLFAYAQVKSDHGSGQFKKDLEAECRHAENLVTAEIADRSGIANAIRKLLSTGR